MKATSSSVAAHLLLHSALFVANSPGAERHAFEVSGYSETVGGTTNRKQFVSATDGPNLFIRCNAGTADKGVDYAEFGTDGTNGFLFSKTLLRANPSSPRGVVNDATMHIEPSPIPPRGGGLIQYIWRSYAGQTELLDRTNSFLKPQGFVRPRELPFDQGLWGMLSEHLLLRAEWELDGRQPHLLKWFVDYRDGKLGSDRYSQSLIPAEFMTGRTNSRMDVLLWTNVAGLHIPIHARYTTYVTETGKPEGPLHVYLVHHVVATNIVAGSKRQDFIPKLSKATEVIDYRFAEGPGRPARYLATNGIILSTVEEIWEEAQRSSQESKQRQQRRTQ